MVEVLIIGLGIPNPFFQQQYYEALDLIQRRTY